MEIGLESEMPTYSGGLGILAGDTIRAGADLNVPMVAVSLLHRKGYFYQTIDKDGWQKEEPAEWVIEDFLQEMPQRASVVVEGRTVHLRAWKFEVKGVGGYVVPVYFLDSDLPENSDWDRALTSFLYGGDKHYRLCQEIILGIGGVRILHALGHEGIDRYHMNEGHASLLTLELFNEESENTREQSAAHDDIKAVRKKCVFTTHTPVPAGHDEFPMDEVVRALGDHPGFQSIKRFFNPEGALNMTYLALNFSHYVNGVAKKHGEISRLMFAKYTIDAITNGVHAATWTSKYFQELFDRHIPGWRQDNFNLRYALSIPAKEMWDSHLQSKKELLHYVNHETNAGMDINLLTLGFARRAATYKRASLLFTDIDRLKNIVSKSGPIQIIYAGKAHPQDQFGKEMIKKIHEVKELLKKDIKIAYLQNYDMDLGKMITSGVDIWLNTPQPPNEASGTSGMKAALNGVPSLSVLDGWWIEGCIEGVTGWAIGENGRGGSQESVDRSRDAASLYEKLEKTVLPLFYNNRERFIDVMRHTIALNGSFFNTHRMMQQYVLNAYFR